MRIATLLPATDRPATRAYAMWLRSVRAFFEMAMRAGVDVLTVPVHDVGLLMPSLRCGVVGPKATLAMTQLFERANEFDLIHDMIGFASLPFAHFITTPILSTLWLDTWRSAPEIVAEMLQAMSGRAYFMAAGDQHHKTGINYTETVPWGIDVESVSFHASSENHIVFFGDLVPHGGAEQAIEFARSASRPLILFGAIQDPAFFETKIAPHLGENVRHMEDCASEQADNLIGRAAAVVHSGNSAATHSAGTHSAGMKNLALLDALCRGTPILSIDDGELAANSSESDCVKNGVTGFHCASVEEAVFAIDRAVSLHREACRSFVAGERALQDQVPAILALYERIIGLAKREDHRPWGYYSVLADEPNHKVKRLVVYPGKRLSLQRHQKRCEHWYVIEGEAMVVQHEDEVRLFPGNSIDIPTGCWHRIRNPGTQNLAIIEVQTGKYFGEDDIERSEDDYGRVAGAKANEPANEPANQTR